MPEAISWSATDAGPDIHFAKAINIALWDRDERGTMKIDLWTKDMPVDEMKHFYVDTIGAMAESVLTATNDSVMATKMRNLCRELMDHMRRNSVIRNNHAITPNTKKPRQHDADGAFA